MARRFSVTVKDEQLTEIVKGLAAVPGITVDETLQRDEPFHSFDVGDYALDSREPTPSPEANTVEILELTGQRSDEFVVEDTGKTVAEHNPFYPDDSPVVKGHYPNMSGDKTFHFPEARLREV